MSRLTTNLISMNTAQATSDRLVDAVLAAMKEKGISQRAMSDATGIPLVTLSRRLLKRSAFTLVELAAVAEVLNLSLVELALRAERDLALRAARPEAATA